jgi:hypothetical protein
MGWESAWGVSVTYRFIVFAVEDRAAFAIGATGEDKSVLSPEPSPSRPFWPDTSPSRHRHPSRSSCS